MKLVSDDFSMTMFVTSMNVGVWVCCRCGCEWVWSVCWKAHCIL